MSFIAPFGQSSSFIHSPFGELVSSNLRASNPRSRV
jgi:hypothetical protein